MGKIILFEGKNATQDIVGTLDDSSEQHINFKIDKRFTNDEVRSIKLENVRPGTIIEVYDDSKAQKNDDWAVIRVKKYLPKIVVGTFQQTVEREDYKITYYQKDNLDGKVSHIKIYPGAPIPSDQITTLEKINQKLLQEYAGWPAKAGTAYEYQSQGSQYRVFKPEVSQTADGGFYLSTKLNHIRSWAKDDYAIVNMSFDKTGTILLVESKVELADLNPISKTFNAVNELPAEQKSNKYVAISVSALKIGTALYEDIQRLAEGGGRLNFPEVIKHNINIIGKVVADAL